MFGSFIVFLLCWIEAKCFDLKYYETILLDIMDDDVEEKVKRSIEVENYSGNGNSDPADLTPESFTPAIIMAIVVASIVALGTFFFLASCAWYKFKATYYQSQPFARVSLDDGDDSALYMVDYDELNAQHSQLVIDMQQEARSETTNINDNKT